eukprot:47850-Rhodomonas_salina.2
MRNGNKAMPRRLDEFRKSAPHRRRWGGLNTNSQARVVRLGGGSSLVRRGSRGSGSSGRRRHVVVVETFDDGIAVGDLTFIEEGGSRFSLEWGGADKICFQKRLWFHLASLALGSLFSTSSSLSQ